MYTKFLWLSEFIPYRILVDSSAPTIQAYFVLFFPMLRQVSPRHFTGVLVGIAAGIGIFNFLRSFFMVSLNSSSSSSIKKYHVIAWQYRALVFRRPIFACPYVWMLCFHISGRNFSGLEVVCFLVSLSPDHVYPSGGSSFNIVNLVNPVQVSDNSRSPSAFQ